MNKKLTCVAVAALTIIACVTLPVYASMGGHKGWYKRVPLYQQPEQYEVILAIRNRMKPAINVTLVIWGPSDLWGDINVWLGTTDDDGIARITGVLMMNCIYYVYTTNLTELDYLHPWNLQGGHVSLIGIITPDENWSLYQVLYLPFKDMIIGPWSTHNFLLDQPAP